MQELPRKKKAVITWAAWQQHLLTKNCTFWHFTNAPHSLKQHFSCCFSHTVAVRFFIVRKTPTPKRCAFFVALEATATCQPATTQAMVVFFCRHYFFECHPRRQPLSTQCARASAGGKTGSARQLTFSCGELSPRHKIRASDWGATVFPRLPADQSRGTTKASTSSSFFSPLRFPLCLSAACPLRNHRDKTKITPERRQEVTFAQAVFLPAPYSWPPLPNDYQLPHQLLKTSMDLWLEPFFFGAATWKVATLCKLDYIYIEG